MSTSVWARVLLGLGLATALAGAAGQEPIYLVPGQGVIGEVLIGDLRSAQDDWREAKRGLEYRTNSEGRVIAIRCRHADCVTDQGLRVRMPESEVIRRYGAPRRDIQTREGGRYYEYPGVGFELLQGGVTAIYVLGRVMTQTQAPAIKVLERAQVRQRHRTLLGGEFDRKVAVYVGDVQKTSAFRMLIYVPKARAAVMEDESDIVPTAVARGEAQSVLLDRRVDPTTREVEFAYNGKTYRLVFDALERRGTDRVIFEVFRK